MPLGVEADGFCLDFGPAADLFLDGELTGPEVVEIRTRAADGAWAEGCSCGASTCLMVSAVQSYVIYIGEHILFLSSVSC